MGLLKHAILPLYALLSLAMVFKTLVAEDMEDIMEAWGRDTVAVPITTVELHFVHCVGGAFIILLVNDIAAIAVENSHYRGMAVLMNVLFFVVDGYSYARLGKSIPGIIFGAVGMGVVGLMVHSKEPGIFTKDKGSGKAKSG
ncbi:hypothetical protein ACHAXR_001302 [Thalassiosira sp. AJA248-18]